MMQTADFGKGDDLPMLWSLHGSALWGILTQAQVGSTSVIVCEVGSEYALEVTLVEHDAVIQTIAPKGTNQPLNVR